MWIENATVRGKIFKLYIGNTEIFQVVSMSILFEYSFPGERGAFKSL